MYGRSYERRGNDGEDAPGRAYHRRNGDGGDEGSDPGYARRISKAGDGPFAAKDGAHDPGGVGRGAWADGHRDLP